MSRNDCTNWNEKLSRSSDLHCGVRAYEGVPKGRGNAFEFRHARWSQYCIALLLLSYSIKNRPFHTL